MRVTSEGQTAWDGRWHVLGHPFDGNHWLSVALLVLLKLSLAWVNEGLVAQHDTVLLNRGRHFILVFVFLFEIWHRYKGLVGGGSHLIRIVRPVHHLIISFIIHVDGMDY